MSSHSAPINVSGGRPGNSGQDIHNEPHAYAFRFADQRLHLDFVARSIMKTVSPDSKRFQRGGGAAKLCARQAKPQFAVLQRRWLYTERECGRGRDCASWQSMCKATYGAQSRHNAYLLQQYILAQLGVCPTWLGKIKRGQDLISLAGFRFLRGRGLFDVALRAHDSDCKSVKRVDGEIAE